MRSLPKLLDEIDLPTRAILLLMAAASGVASFAGNVTVIGGDVGFFLKALAGIVATSVSAFLYLFWSYAFAIGPGLRWIRDFVSLTWITLAGFVVIFCVSTLTSVVGFANQALERLHLKKNETVAENMISSAKSQVNGVTSAITGLSAAGDFFSSQAQAESAGLGDGAAGCGVRCRNLQSAARAITGLSDSIKKEVQTRSKLFVEADRLLSELRAVSDAPIDDAERNQLAAENISALNGILGQLETDGLFAAVEQGLGPLAESFIVAPPRNDAQREAVEKIAVAIRQRSAPILAEMAILRAESSIEPISFERPNAVLLVFANWRSTIVQIAIGLALDVGPGLILLFRILAVAAIRRGAPTASKAPQNTWTTEELLEAKEILKRLIEEEVKSAETPPAADKDRGEN